VAIVNSTKHTCKRNPEGQRELGLVAYSASIHNIEPGACMGNVSVTIVTKLTEFILKE